MVMYAVSKLMKPIRDHKRQENPKKEEEEKKDDDKPDIIIYSIDNVNNRKRRVKFASTIANSPATLVVPDTDTGN